MFLVFKLIYEVTYICEPAGSEPRIGRRLIDWEGVILSV